MTRAEIQGIYGMYSVTIFMVMSLDLTALTPTPSEFVDPLLPEAHNWTVRYLSLVKSVMIFMTSFSLSSILIH